jgi:uncharacterized membrane protein
MENGEPGFPINILHFQLFIVNYPFSVPMAHLLFSDEQTARIVDAIQDAERGTSGEVRVHIERTCPKPDVLERAREVFAMLGMHRTEQHNGVLFYLAVDDHKFAVIGDSGIHAAVPAHFWEDTRDVLREHFRAGQFTEGLCQGIARAGQHLKAAFPFHNDDINELPDDISFG